MKKGVVVGIFAHPDDEAFGPGGTLAKFAKTHDVYLITVTGGEAGQCSLGDHEEELSDIRRSELMNAARILGVKKAYCLGFEDGTLSNNSYHSIAGKIKKILDELRPEIVITFEPKGVSGHIDHITVSLVTTYVVNRLDSVVKLLYFCVTPKERKDIGKDYFIFFPKGYKESETDWTCDIADEWETKLNAIRAHKSQQHDAQKIIKTLKSLPKEEHFLLFKP